MSKSKAGDLFIASVIHVRRGTKDHPVTETIQPGQLTSDTDLTAEEIKDLRRHKGVLRAPTFEELQEMDTREERQKAAQAVRDAEQERADLADEQELERQRLLAEQRVADEKERVRLETEQAKERAKVEADAAKAGAKGAKK